MGYMLTSPSWLPPSPKVAAGAAAATAAQAGRMAEETTLVSRKAPESGGVAVSARSGEFGSKYAARAAAAMSESSATLAPPSASAPAAVVVPTPVASAVFSGGGEAVSLQRVPPAPRMAAAGAACGVPVDLPAGGGDGPLLSPEPLSCVPSAGVSSKRRGGTSCAATR